MVTVIQASAATSLDQSAGERMAKSELAGTIDSLLSATIAPPLKAVGFRKRGREWTRAGTEAFQRVHVQASQGNWGGLGRFWVIVGVQYPTALTVDDWDGAVQFTARLDELAPGPWFVEGFQFDVSDPASLERLRTELDRKWELLGEAFVAAADTPRGLCDHCAAKGGHQAALHALEAVAERIGDRAAQVKLLERAIERAATKGEFATGARPPLAYNVLAAFRTWGDIQWHRRRLGITDPLGPRAADVARAVLSDAANDFLASGRDHTVDDEDDARGIADMLGMDCPQFADLELDADAPRRRPYPSGS